MRHDSDKAQIIEAGKEQSEALLDGIELAVYLLGRCKIYEKLYLSTAQKYDALSHLEKGLILLYTALMRFFARAMSLDGLGRIRKIINAVFSPDEFLELRKRCKDLAKRVDGDADNCERHLQNSARAAQTAESTRLKVMLPEFHRSLDALNQRSEKEETSMILTWTSQIPYEDDHDKVRRNCTPGTGQWLLKHDRYLEWQNSPRSILLWLKGSAGAGKTYLMSTVIDHIKTLLQTKSKSEGFAYFYCNYVNVSGNQRPLSVLHSCIKQLSLSEPGSSKFSIQPCLRQVYNDKFGAGFASNTINYAECKSLLETIVEAHSSITIVLDAIDECHEEERSDLIEALEELVKVPKRTVKILISSRPDDGLLNTFRRWPTVEIEATQNHNDIAMFVRDALEKDSSRRSRQERELLSDSLQDVIIQTLLKKSQGMCVATSFHIYRI